MAVHMRTPAVPNVAACGDENAKAFTPWRWKATCADCKLVTAAHVVDDQTTERSVIYRQDLPVRFSSLVALRAYHRSGERRRGYRRVRAARCNRHGELKDPIALLDASNNRMVFVCPDCIAVTQPKLRARWENER
jgi:hypothetical protein